MITFTSLTGNIVALLGGIVFFHDPVGHTPPQIADVHDRVDDGTRKRVVLGTRH